MKNRRMNVLSAAVISAIAAGTLVFSGCMKDQEVLKDRPMIPPPSNVEPAKPVIVQPVLPAAPAPIVKPATEQVVPK